MRGDLEKVLFDEPAIHRRLDDMAAQISNDYRDFELTVIAVLPGSLMVEIFWYSMIFWTAVSRLQPFARPGKQPDRTAFGHACC